MTGSMHIPWTPRTVWNPVTLKVEDNSSKNLCERTIAILQPIIWNALKPFPDARYALSLALLAFDDGAIPVPG
jgi:hypothetical protein